VPLLSGREFSLEDQVDSSGERPKPVVLNQTAAELLFAGANPLGRTIRDDEGVFTVAGVVKDLSSGFMMATPAPTMFVPLTARHIGATFAPGVTVLLRGRPGAAPIEAAMNEIWAVDPELTIFDQRTFEQELAQFDRVIRWSSILNGSLAAFAMLLSLIGLFSITVHAVARRRKEIGIRVALGARRDQVMRLVLREGVGLVAVGGLLGFAAAYALARVFSSITSRFAEVFAIGTDDPLFTVAAPLLWVSVALLACYLPARRALKIDPAATLKAE
jgi:predicted lysophospholipase L1 biosynthesis ABC-type transport system permease subunit